MIQNTNQNLTWIDTHAHLNHPYPFTLETYLENAKQNGVQTIVTIGTELADFDVIEKLASTYENVYYTVGIHPHEASHYKHELDSVLLKHLKNSKCVAIGEIGLDYYYNHSNHADQKIAFEAQLNIAEQVEKPIVIHSRDGEADLLAILEKHCARLSPKIKNRPGVIHCFSGTRNFAMESLRLGFYISISGIATFKSAEDIRQTIKDVPLDRLLLETDAPFLAPIPYRGKPNQSSYMIETAKVVAAMKSVSLEELSQKTTQNARDLFLFS